MRAQPSPMLYGLKGGAMTKKRLLNLLIIVGGYAILVVVVDVIYAYIDPRIRY